MWLLENLGDAFQGRRLWLRPGKLYLLGRTVSEPGQLAISHKTISRKHLTIRVESVKEGDGQNRNSRSSVTVEDLNTKIGTLLNGSQIRGQKIVLSQDSNQIKMGNFADLFRIAWHPVVLSFSFTSKELRADPWTKLRSDLEQLDIKYIADYDITLTTHVVAKKRNTPKGLQALINGKYIVTDTFITAVIEAATPSQGGADANAGQLSRLEQDFDGNWPNPLEYLPPRGEEPSDRPVSTYAPDERRKDIFDGYTFIFYDQKQYENLFPPITNGKGKALLREVVPGETEIDDFVRYVKGVAGEKGLGEFENGSEGKGVVVVRYLPAKGDHCDWFTQFTTAVSLRLDHRLIDQREFLDAILANEPGMLRRPLEVETGTQPEPPQSERRLATRSSARQAEQVEAAGSQEGSGTRASDEESRPPTRRGRPRRAVASRFKGFDADLDIDKEPAAATVSAVASQGESMFVSQNRASEEPQPDAQTARSSQRKRPAPITEDEIMEDIAPTAAAVKRRRVEAGEAPVPPREELESVPEAMDEDEAPETEQNDTGKSQKSKKKTKGKEDDVLDLARQNREAAEKRAAAERERLAQVPDDGVDAEEIRRLTLVEEIEVRQPSGGAARGGRGGRGSRGGSQGDAAEGGADGRWDPRWNGRRNFKKFRRQGDPVGRAVPRVIVGLEPVKTKEYGIGDDYWLEGGGESGSQRRKKKDSTQESSQAAEQGTSQSHAPKGKAPAKTRTAAAASRRVVRSESSDDDDEVMEVQMTPQAVPETAPESEPELELPQARPEPEPEPEPDSDSELELRLPRTRAGKAAERANTRQSQRQAQLQLQTQTQTTQSQAQTRSKRVAAAAPAKEKPAKKARGAAAARAKVVKDSDDSEDELQFRFGKRR